jgi:hypothetical protein
MIDSLAVHVKEIFAVRGEALRGVGEGGILDWRNAESTP